LLFERAGELLLESEELVAVDCCVVVFEDGALRVAVVVIVGLETEFGFDFVIGVVVAVVTLVPSASGIFAISKPHEQNFFVSFGPDSCSRLHRGHFFIVPSPALVGCCCFGGIIGCGLLFEVEEFKLVPVELADEESGRATTTSSISSTTFSGAGCLTGGTGVVFLAEVEFERGVRCASMPRLTVNDCPELAVVVAGLLLFGCTFAFTCDRFVPQF
jgi:hypothetical protein